MLVFRILGTVFVGISILTMLFKNAGLATDDDLNIKLFSLWSVWGLAWRAFVIVALWMI